MSPDKTFASVVAEERMRTLRKIERAEAIKNQYVDFSRFCRKNGRVEKHFSDFVDQTAVPIYEKEIEMYQESLKLLSHALTLGCAEITSELNA